MESCFGTNVPADSFTETYHKYVEDQNYKTIAAVIFFRPQRVATSKSGSNNQIYDYTLQSFYFFE